MRLSSRDKTVLQVLTHRVRVLSLAQVARAFWPDARDSKATARRRLAELQEAELTRSLTLLARPVRLSEQPILAWAPGEPLPELGPVAYRCQRRWIAPLRPVPAVIASVEAGHRFGGHGGRAPRASEASHDIGLSEVYLAVRRADPRRAERWISEAALYEQGWGRDAKLPDAVVRESGGDLAIEFAGGYSKRKLQEFHDYCEERELPYELW